MYRPLASSAAVSAGSPGSACSERGPHRREVGELATFEQRVVDRGERREVLVERRRLDAEPAGDLGEAQPGDALLLHDVLGEVEDLGHGLETPAGPSIGRLPGFGGSGFDHASDHSRISC